MITNDKRVRIITGHYGSGKTEFAVNYVMKLREMVDGQVAIADLDVVNPYFRSREKKSFLQEKNIRVIDSSVDGRCVDIPALPAEVTAPMVANDYDYVVDLGGDHVGARAFARFAGSLDKDNYDLFFVINANREQTADPKGVIEHMEQIEETTGLKVTGLINNTHMVRETTAEDVIKGHELAKKVSKIKGIPIKYTACIDRIAAELPEEMRENLFEIKMYMREDWM